MTLGVRNWFQGIGESRRCAFGMPFGHEDISTHPNLLFYKEGMAERTGLEPATPGVTVESIANIFNNLQRLRTHKFAEY